jgi:hypothetical protein
VEIDKNTIGVAGLIKNNNTISPDSTVTTALKSAIIVNPNNSGAIFELDAITQLANYSGVFYMINKSTAMTTLTYNSPDGLYPSDVEIDIGGNFVIAESSLYSLNGRIIKLDFYGNIIWNYGNANFTFINDAKPLLNGDILISV